MKRLVLIDGSALYFRAFFAIPASFTTKSGLHTNAIYGFATMFRKLLSGRTPDYGAVIFDPPGPTFREKAYAEYKAQRPRMPRELVEQLPHIDRLVDAHRMKRLRVEGYESDDVIGTLTEQGRAAGLEVIIISGDKDFAQLVGDEVKMFDPMREVTYDRELVKKKWGVAPEHITDLLGLVGDSADNIPGVPGIGEKGAAKLITLYGEMEDILRAAPSLKGKQREALLEHAETARLSKSLATIDRAVPLPFGLEALAYEPPDAEALNALFVELEFYSLISGEGGMGAGDAKPADGPEVRVLPQAAEIQAELEARMDAPYVVALPLFEGGSAATGQVVGLVLASPGASALYVPLGEAADSRSSALASLLGAERPPKITHNAKELLLLAKRQGLSVRGLDGDTMLASFLVDPTRLIPHRLDQLVKEYLHRTIPAKKTLTGAGQKERSLAELPTEEVAALGASWAQAVLELWPLLESRLLASELDQHLLEIDLPLAQVLAKMELAGIRVDQADLERMSEEFLAQLARLETQIHGIAGHPFNIASTKQLAAVLFEELKLPVVKKTKTGYSTDQEVLERLAPKHEVAGLLLEHRKLSKLVSTYTEVLRHSVNPATGRIHASFEQTTSATGRLITTNPDLQRTPIKTPEGRRIRQTFVAPPGFVMLSADWSQIELRLLAHVSKDPVLVEAFQGGLDIHTRTASEIFEVPLGAVNKEQRNVAKTINFATIYGQGASALGQILGIKKAEAEAYIRRYFETYAGVRAWLDETIEAAHRDGFVTTLFGRRRIIPELSSHNFMDRAAGERIAANTPIQGSAADICKLAMLQIDRALAEADLRSRMLLQIHDELVFECPEAEVETMRALVKRRMEEVYPLAVPLVAEVGVGPSWGDAH